MMTRAGNRFSALRVKWARGTTVSCVACDGCDMREDQGRQVEEIYGGRRLHETAEVCSAIIGARPIAIVLSYRPGLKPAVQIAQVHQA